MDDDDDDDDYAYIAAYDELRSACFAEKATADKDTMKKFVQEVLRGLHRHFGGFPHLKEDLFNSIFYFKFEEVVAAAAAAAAAEEEEEDYSEEDEEEEEEDFTSDDDG